MGRGGKGFFERGRRRCIFVFLVGTELVGVVFFFFGDLEMLEVLGFGNAVFLFYWFISVVDAGYYFDCC